MPPHPFLSHVNNFISHHRKLIIIFIVLAVAWTAIHETLHMVALAALGRSFEFHFNILNPTVACLDCAGATPEQVLFYSSLPYLFDLAMLALCLTRKSSFWSVVAIVAFIDVSFNFIMSLVLVILNIHAFAADFIVMSLVGYYWAGIVIFAIASFIGIAMMWLYMKKKSDKPKP